MELVRRLQQDAGIGTCHIIGTCTFISVGTGTSSGTSTSDSRGTCSGTGVGAHDVDYFLTAYGLVRFRDRIYLSHSNELKKVILKEFHVKPYSCHPSYQKTLTAMKIF